MEKSSYEVLQGHFSFHCLLRKKNLLPTILVLGRCCTAWRHTGTDPCPTQLPFQHANVMQPLFK